ncbi:hypothetical protein [Pseudodesulfovibrio portus]|uniref:Uncharacterized protein n=1 Tax=Pseudodesulfovibrio portus TaxID=231439 RepID=A0ABM8AS60_9BACT|nr:hypothetical protein [Pseudodesulfovibrio portus]BDQ34283.1 hypothetical protein JCM14722_18250 [Pseudodesulfovibrio portus]
MSYLSYLFQPEDSTLGVTEAAYHKIPWSVRTFKTALWIGVSMIMSVGISQLS